MGNWLAHGNTNDVIGIREGFETYLPMCSKIVDSPDQADIIVLCLGEKKKMSGENGSVDVAIT